MNKKLFYLFIGILFSSCSVTKQIASIETGGITTKDSISQNETYIQYDSLVRPSNKIEFKLYKNEKNNKDKRSKGKFGIDQNNNNQNDAYAIVSKYFYHYNVATTITNIIAVIGAIPTLGQTLYVVRNPHERTLTTFDFCKEDCLCVGQTYHRKILLEVDVVCLKGQLNDSIVVVEKLPSSIKLNSYKIKIMQGKRQINTIDYQSFNIENQSANYFIIKPMNNSFSKDCVIWIILDVDITPTEKDFIN